MNIPGPIVSPQCPARWAVFEPGEPPSNVMIGQGPQRQARNGRPATTVSKAALGAVICQQTGGTRYRATGTPASLSADA
jgi:hypothetical protein